LLAAHILESENAGIPALRWSDTEFHCLSREVNDGIGHCHSFSEVTSK
jgi:hypothetical protein